MNYKIRPGDTLSALAARFHTSVGALARANGIKNVNLIYAGATLRVDSFTPSPSKPGKPGGSSSTGGVRPTGSVQTGSMGQRLASAARNAAMGMGGYHSQGLCATGVSRAIVNAMGIKVWGNGNQIDDNLPRNKFKQINIPLSEALKIPGLVLTWERTSTTLGAKYGHTAITLGDGHSSASDFIENNTLAGNASRSGLKIFMPI